MTAQSAVQQTLKDWCAASNQPGEAGASGYAAYVTEDAVLLPPNAERIEGRDGIRRFALNYTGADAWSVNWEPTEISILPGGDLAYAIGKYRLRLTDAGGNAVEDTGKFLDILARQSDGSWKVSALSFNSDLPADEARRLTL